MNFLGRLAMGTGLVAAAIGVITAAALTNAEKEFEKKEKCAVCNGDASKGHIVILSPCGHVVHTECLELIKGQKKCPVCRESVSERHVRH